MIEYRWTGTGGSIAEPSERETIYTCEEDGDWTIILAVSDDGFDGCVDERPFSVTCVSIED